MSFVKVFTSEVLRYKDEYLKFEPTDSLEIKDEKLIDLLVKFGVAKRLSGESIAEPTKVIEKKEVKEALEQLPFVEVVEEMKEEKPKKEGKKSRIFFEEN